MIAKKAQDEHCVILSVSSDIGLALAADWLDHGFSVSGTFRTHTDAVRDLESKGLHAVQLDLGNVIAVEEVAEQLGGVPWNRLVLAAGSQEPVGLFEQVDPIEWGKSIQTNFVAQFQFLAWMLPFRQQVRGKVPRVLSFAGGATNRATTHYSAYTISKIASIKMTELLAAEAADMAFTILGPGWVRTKIHEATLEAGMRAGDNLETTVRHLQNDDFFPMEILIRAINWIMEAPPEAISGRNISAVHDPWGSAELTSSLISDPDLYKLRRFGNERFASSSR